MSQNHTGRGPCVRGPRLVVAARDSPRSGVQRARGLQLRRPMPVPTFRDLLAWQEALKLVRDVYALSAVLPREERFGLAAQMKRAVVSIPSNIAEGARRRRRLTFRY